LRLTRTGRWWPEFSADEKNHPGGWLSNHQNIKENRKS
jgi:hypothetical protein